MSASQIQPIDAVDEIATPGLYCSSLPGASTDSLVLETPLDTLLSDASQFPEVITTENEDEVFTLWRKFDALSVDKHCESEVGTVRIKCGAPEAGGVVIELKIEVLRESFANWGLYTCKGLTSFENPDLDPLGVETFFELIAHSPLTFRPLSTLPLPALDTAHHMSSVFGLTPLVDLISSHRARRIGIDAPLNFKKAARDGDIASMAAAIGSLGIEHHPAEAVRCFWERKDPYCRIVDQIISDLKDGRESRGGGTFWQAVAVCFEARARQYQDHLSREPVGRPAVQLEGETSITEKKGWLGKMGRSMRRLVK